MTSALSSVHIASQHSQAFSSPATNHHALFLETPPRNHTIPSRRPVGCDPKLPLCSVFRCDQRFLRTCTARLHLLTSPNSHPHHPFSPPLRAAQVSPPPPPTFPPHALPPLLPRPQSPSGLFAPNPGPHLIALHRLERQTSNNRAPGGPLPLLLRPATRVCPQTQISPFGLIPETLQSNLGLRKILFKFGSASHWKTTTTRFTVDLEHVHVPEVRNESITLKRRKR